MNSIINNIFGKNNDDTINSIDQNQSNEKEIPAKKTLVRGSGGKFVSTKTPEELALIAKLKAEKKVNKEPLLRGAHGKFISKQNATSPETVIENTPPSLLHTPLPDANSMTMGMFIQTSTFYGIIVRKFYKEGIWYFSLLDILPIAKTIYPVAYFEELKNDPEGKKILSENIVIFTHVIDEENNQRLECISYETFMQLLPIMRKKGSIFPGPFPGWLEERSKEEANNI